MTEEKQDLVKCSRCQRRMLLSFFSVKATTGMRYKTCNKCRVKHKCSQCEYKCSTAGDLVKHIKAIHTKIKNIICPQCDTTFSDNCNLLSHIRSIHNNHECHQCEYKCSDSSSLQKHIKRIHLQIKNNECKNCEYKCS